MSENWEDFIKKMGPSTKKIDYSILAIAIALVFCGILILFSVSSYYSQETFGSVYYLLRRQLIFGLLPGLTLGFFVFKIPIKQIKKFAFPLLLINLLFLGLVFLPGIGLKSGGARRWVDFGFFSFQPSEFFKLSFLIYLAAWLSGRAKKYKNIGESFLPFLIVAALTSILLIRQPDVGTLGIIIVSGFLMYFIAGTPLWHSLFLILLLFSGLLTLIKTRQYRWNRLLVFLRPNIDPMGKGYQIRQALIAIGSGGIFGLGLGMSRQKFGFLPQPIGDAIFAVFAEETGFIGSFILLALFFLFFWQGIKIIKKVQEPFQKLLASGIIFWFILQTFVNIGSVSGILPLTGVPLPFISYGGSHLIAELVGVGILLNISKEI